MAIEIKHAFVSAKGDGADATLVRPSNWNAIHGIQMATNAVIGRLTAGPGDAEELPITAFMAALLNTADLAALSAALGLFTTGDAKLTFKSIADTGWVLANDGTIGNTGSGATLAATTTSALFTLFFNNFSDAVCPLQTSAGGATTRGAQGTATLAYGNNCRMVIPKTLGRALVVAGTGVGLSARTLGATGGEETHVLSANESAQHTHTGSNWTGSGTGTGSGTAAATSGSFNVNTGGISANHTHSYSWSGDTGTMSADHVHSSYGNTNNLAPSGAIISGSNNVVNPLNTGGASANHVHGYSGSASTGPVSADHVHNVTGSVAVTSTPVTVSSLAVTVTGVGGTTSGVAGFNGAAHNNMQPWTAWNIMIRL